MSADPVIYCLENLTDYRQFERLCCDLMNRFGYSDIEPLGGSNDRGRDALLTSKSSPGDTTIFAFSVRGDWYQKLVNEDCRRIQEEGHELQRLVFACTASITSSQRDSAIAKVKNDFGWDLELFGIDRLRVRLVGDLRDLIAKHPAIFCPPFFPTRGGLSIVHARDTLVIDHHSDDHALATWLARRLTLLGYHVWSYGTAPLAGEHADESIRTLIETRAIRYLPILSNSFVAEPDALSRCSLALQQDGLMLPCRVESSLLPLLPSKMKMLEDCDFSTSWSNGVAAVSASLEASGVHSSLDSEQRKMVALRSYVPEPVTKDSSETVYANTFATAVPGGIQVCELTRKLKRDEVDEIRKTWAFVIADDKTLLGFDDPPSSVPRRSKGRLPSYSWKDFEFRYQKRSTHVVKELIRRTLDVACVNAGLEWCDDRKKFYFVTKKGPQLNLRYTHVDGRQTRIAATGEKSYGWGERAIPFRYQLCPTYSAGQDESGAWWVTLRPYVRVTDVDGKPYQKKAITRRRKNVTKSWWNKEWFARNLALIQALAQGNRFIIVGASGHEVKIDTRPLKWVCPIAVDYEAVARIGDFQQEMAEIRFFAEEDDVEDD